MGHFSMRTTVDEIEGPLFFLIPQKPTEGSEGGRNTTEGTHEWMIREFTEQPDDELKSDAW